MRQFSSRLLRRLQDDDMVNMALLCTIVPFLFLALSSAARMLKGDGGSDFELFRLVGDMARHGHLAEAYSPTALHAAEVRAFGTPTVLPSYAYPPQFGLLDMLFTATSLVPAYLIFIATSFAAWIAILALWGKRALAGALLLAAPAIYVNIWGGQNGFVTASLVTGFAFLFLRGRAEAGIPLGLMVIKPHLALGLAILVLVRRRFDVAAWAIGAAVVSGLVATMVFGMPAWAEFLHGARAASHMLIGNDFPFYRMVSLYASARAIGLDPSVAMALHLAAAIPVAVTIAVAAWRESETQATVGLAILGSLMISPYAYDYDLPTAGFALMLMAPTLRALDARWRAAAVVLTLATCSWGMGWGLATANFDPAHPHPVLATDHLTLAGIAGVALFALCATAVFRHARVPAYHAANRRLADLANALRLRRPVLD